jgi:hypothetical protein
MASGMLTWFDPTEAPNRARRRPWDARAFVIAGELLARAGRRGTEERRSEGSRREDASGGLSGGQP